MPEQDLDIAAWLRSMGLERYAQAFLEAEVTPEALSELTDADLRELGLPLGPRKVVLRAIRGLIGPLTTGVVVSETPRAEAGPSISVPSQAERRQLTVMFVDLVGSTALSAKLDPEEMREIIRAYQDQVAGEILRYEGHVASFMGDGALAYFGWPSAHENNAERAVCAGLAVTAAVGSLRAPSGAPLRARVGIATGLVVVGELVGAGVAREEVVIGGAPNLAARLQAIAKPGTVVVAPSTRRLIGSLFECIELRERRLKGFAAPVRAWHVIGNKEAESRFEALRGASLGRMVGRDQELALLVDRWGKVKDGEGQAVLLSGEAGVGKSRLVRALYDRLRPEPGTRMRLQCSPYHVHSPLWPMIIYLERAARLDRDASAETRRRSLTTAFAPRTVAADLPLFLELLGISGDDGHPLPSLTPQQKKRRIFDALISYLQSLARRQPVLMVLEDAQWMDPTTREFFDSVVEGVGRLPVLLVVIARPDALPLWAGHLHVTALMLSRLSGRQVDELIALVANGMAALSKEAVEQIRVRADGVPLFIEELTKMVIETRPVREVDGRFQLARPLPPLAIPATLRDSLMARLDRLQPAKAAAQAGAVLGREFSYKLLAAVSRLREGTLRSALDRLGEAGLILPRGAPPEATYVFKHALVRDAAYETLLRSERPLLHARVVCVLEERFPGTAELEPELLAHHCAEAGLAEKSVGYRLKAGRQAIARSALPEAVEQLSRGLEELTRVPHEATRLQLELELQVALGIALAIARGWPAMEMGQAFARARELCAFLDSDAELFQALYGLAIFHLMRAEPETTRRLALEMLGRATKCDDVGLKIAARQVLGSALHVSGRFADAQSQYAQLLELYNLEWVPASRFTHFFDPRAATLSILARVYFLLGHPTQAMVRSEEALAAADRLQHPPTVAFVLVHRCFFLQLLGERTLLRTAAEALVRVATEQDFAAFLAYGTMFGGWALADGKVPNREAVRLIRDGLHRLRAAGHRLDLPYALSLMSCVQGDGDVVERRQLLEEALQGAEDTGERWFEAELHRLRGELLLAPATSDEARAEACFGRAIAVAREQNARMLELRGAASLARLWAGQGRRREGLDLLVRTFGWFTEGFDTPDLREAKALLDELQ